MADTLNKSELVAKIASSTGQSQATVDVDVLLLDTPDGVCIAPDGDPIDGGFPDAGPGDTSS